MILESPPDRVLVLCFQRLGDVLLATALIRSLRRAWPRARLDALVFANTTQALAGNPDVNEVIAWPTSGGLIAGWRSMAAIFRRYSLAVSTLPTDRTHLTAWAAAPMRVGVVPPPAYGSARWKRWLNRAWLETELHDTHVVRQYLRLAGLLGASEQADVVPPRSDAQPIERALGARWREMGYAVIHPAPMYPYKAWTVEGWRQLMAWFANQGIKVMLSSGPAPAELEFVRALARDARPGSALLVDRLRLPEMTPLLEHARVYVGPDTSVTHLAAATGVPTVALFGPMSPVTWGPWPQGFTDAVKSPWVLTAPWQQRGNVWLLQGVEHCVPCLREGCERRPDSRADCLAGLPASRVIAAVDQALRRGSGRTARGT